jgi:hypothetical protein
MKSAELQALLNKTWTTSDLSAMFGVTDMAIYWWRKHKELPAIEIGGGDRATIRYVPTEVMAWAKANRIKIKRGSDKARAA